MVDNYLACGVLLAPSSLPVIGLAQAFNTTVTMDYCIFAVFAFAGLIVTTIGLRRSAVKSKWVAMIVGPVLFLVMVPASAYLVEEDARSRYQRAWISRSESRLENMYLAMYEYLDANGSLPISIGILIGDDKIINEVKDVLEVSSVRSPHEVMVGNYTFQQWLDKNFDLTTIDTSKRWEKVGDFLLARQPPIEAFINQECVLGLGPECPFKPGARIVLFGDMNSKLIPSYEAWRKQYNRNLPKYAIPIPDWPNK